MMMRKITFAVFFVLLFCKNLYSQESTVDQNDKRTIAVYAKPTEGGIHLRWAPADPLLWQFAVEYGYSIERVTIVRNGQMLQTPEKIMLNSTTLLPKELDDWESAVERNDYAAVAAQCIYGETLTVADSPGGIMSIVNKANELESRFSFALFAADQGIEIAELSGLYFFDHETEKTEGYVYRVFANIPKEKVEVDTGFVYVNAKDIKALPMLQEPQAKEEDGLVVIKWNTALFDHIYSTYDVERSVDGMDYKVINKYPIVTISPNDGPSKERASAYYVDSLTVEGNYYYRIRGKTIFDEISPPSDSLHIPYYKLEPLPSPLIKGHELDETGKLSIDWKVEGNWIRGLKASLLRSEKVDGIFKTVQSVNEVKKVTDPQPNRLSFYKILLTDSLGRQLFSPAEMIQLIDSIPPSKPELIVGRANLEGEVLLKWKRNLEDDLIGYRVFRANYLNEEPSLLHVDLVQDTFYIDKLHLKNLSKSVYYYVTAIDMVQNASEFSNPIKVDKPNIVKPDAPFIHAIKFEADSVKISFKKSREETVVNYMLYRRITGEQYFQLAKVVPSGLNETVDVDKLKNGEWEYLLIAVNDAGIESEPSNLVKCLVTAKLKKMELITHVKKENGIYIAWPKEVKGRVKIYKDNDDGIFNLLVERQNINTYTDLNVQRGKAYNYKIQIVSETMVFESKAINITY